MTDWIRKCDPSFCIFQEIHLTIKGRNYIKVKGWEKVFQEGGTKKQASIAILTADKIYFKPQIFRKYGKVHYYTFTKGKNHQEDVTILNIHTPNTVVINFIKEK